MKNFVTLCSLLLLVISLSTLPGCGSGSTTSFPVSATSFYVHSLAVRSSDNTVFASGNNAFGQLGINSTSNSATPQTVQFSSADKALGVLGVSAGGNHSLAVMKDSSVRSWGYNGFGQLGDGTNGSTASKKTPVQVTVVPDATNPSVFVNFSSVTQVAAGGNHSLALKRDGTVRSWGNNTFGQLGDNSSAHVDSNRPVTVVNGSSGSPLALVNKIAAGGNHSLALVNGDVYAWGDNTFGQLGLDPKSTTFLNVASLVSGVSNVKLIAAGGAFNVAVTDDNKVFAWGYNGFGQLGIDPKTDPLETADRTFRSAPVEVVLPKTGTVIAISAGLDHVLLLMSDGTLFSWGYDGFGQLGVDPTTFSPASVFRRTPTEVKDTTNTTLVFDTVATVDGLSPILAVGHQSFAIDKATGKLKGFGSNNFGQLGNGVTDNKTTPTTVSGF